MTNAETILQKCNEMISLREKATQGEWAFGSWTIFDKDRDAQKRRDPYWTLVEGDDVLAVGPLGSKYLDTKSIISPSGYEADGLNVEGADAKLIVYAANSSAQLAKALKIVTEALGMVDAVGMVEPYDRIVHEALTEAALILKEGTL